MAQPAWRCAAPHCPTKYMLPKILRKVWQCQGCGKFYHAGCSGGTGSPLCDECWAKETRA